MCLYVFPCSAVEGHRCMGADMKPLKSFTSRLLILQAREGLRDGL